MSNDGEDDEFSFQDWAKNNELTTNTLSALMDNGFETAKSITKLTPEKIDSIFKRNLSAAQKLLLADAIDELRPQKTVEEIRSSPQENSQAGTSNSDRGCMDDMQKKLDRREALSMTDIMAVMAAATTGTGIANQPITAAESAHVTTGTDMAAPLQNNLPRFGSDSPINGMLSFLTTGAVKNKRASMFRDVRDYVSLVPGSAEKGNSFDMGPFQLKVKDSKIPLGRLSQAQYMEGALRILVDMAKTDKCVS